MTEYRKEGIFEKPLTTMNGIAMVFVLIVLVALEVFSVAAVRNPAFIVAIAVAECAQIVGVLLVFTLMVGPAAAALAFTRRLPPAIALATGFALAEAWGGLTLAFYSDWPVSFWITALSGAIYFASLLRWRKLAPAT